MLSKRNNRKKKYCAQAFEYCLASCEVRSPETIEHIFCLMLYILFVHCVFFLFFFRVVLVRTKAFLSPNFYFRVHSTNEKGKKTENLFCHWVECPNVTYKKKVCLCKIWNRFSYEKPSRKKGEEHKYEFDFELMLWQENCKFTIFSIWQRKWEGKRERKRLFSNSEIPIRSIEYNK